MTIYDDAISIQEIEKMLDLFYKNYNEKWLEGILELPVANTYRYNKKDNQYLLYLGGGAGFISKTTTYQLKPKEVAKKEIFAELGKRFKTVKLYRNQFDMPKNVPLALKGAQGHANKEKLQMGLCEISFEEKEVCN